MKRSGTDAALALRSQPPAYRVRVTSLEEDSRRPNGFAPTEPPPLGQLDSEAGADAPSRPSHAAPSEAGYASARRVAELRRAIAAGTFKLDYEKIARRLLGTSRTDR